MTTTTINNNTIAITTTLNATDFFNAITGSDFYGCTEFVAPRSLSVNEKKKTITFRYYDLTSGSDEYGDYNKTIRTVVTLEQLANAFSQLVQNNQTHCGGYPLSNLENADACLCFMVLQQAIYGELMF
jgi:hypothetical protein